MNFNLKPPTQIFTLSSLDKIPLVFVTLYLPSSFDFDLRIETKIHTVTQYVTEAFIHSHMVQLPDHWPSTGLHRWKELRRCQRGHRGDDQPRLKVMLVHGVTYCLFPITLTFQSYALLDQVSLVFWPVPCSENQLLLRKGITDGICRLTTSETYKWGLVTPAKVTL